jgi:murein L,D-transpeptidase YcbB/YkuD
MRGLRSDGIMLGTALALVLASPLAASPQEAGQPAKVAAVPLEAPAPRSPQAQSAPNQETSQELPANEQAASATENASNVPANAEDATEPAAKRDTVAALDPADRAIAEKIRDLLSTESDKIFSGSEERQKVEAFYHNRQFAPLWLDKGVANARAASVANRLTHADTDGLEPGDYRIASFAGDATDALAGAELAFTHVVITFARHLQAGRFSRHQLKYEIGLPQAAPDPEQVLARLAGAADPGAALDEFSPQNEPYRRLKAMLATMRGRSGGAADTLPEGPVLRTSRKHEMEDARVPRLRARLGLTGEASDLRYDSKLSEAVKEFQRANDLPATGNLDSRTLRKLNGPAPDHRQIETIIANMERWRWYPRDLGEAHVLVNLPDFTLEMMHKGAQIWASRIVIGEPKRPTPLLSEKMNSVTLNPVWHVPPSIVHNEYLPALARDHNVLARMGLHLSYKDGEAQITMPAGGINPLGHIRFNFYNRFTVFQHDTPDQYMFGHAVRAESHGCMRVEHAAKYAELLFSIARPDEHWTAQKVKSMYGGAEQEIEIESTPIWLHLTYQTAFVDDDGKLQIRRDLYNLDRQTLAAIKGGPVAASVPERKHEQETASASRHHRRTAHSLRGDARSHAVGRVLYR